MKRRRWNVELVAAAAMLWWAAGDARATGSAGSFAFIHPGLMHTRNDLARISNAVAMKLEPVMSGFLVFSNHPQSQLSYRTLGAFEDIGRNPEIHFRDFDLDASAAYQFAVMWHITGDNRYAQKAISILNAWSSKLKRCGGTDAVLMAGLGPFKLLNAAELLRDEAGWKATDIEQSRRMFKEVIYPVLKDFAPFANGNWDAAAMQTLLAIGVFCDEQPIFERGLRYYVNGSGNGALMNYIINTNGQCQESGRDQQHTQLGLGLLADCCEIAWSQGLDLYGFDDNRLLKGFEYTAKYNLGQDVSFTDFLDRTGKYHHKRISPRGRGRLRPIFEQVFNHYVHRRGIEASFTEQAANRVRPEGAARIAADHPGFGTLFYTCGAGGLSGSSQAVRPAAPGGLIAKGSVAGNQLTWVASARAASYTVRRASTEGGPYAILATNVASAAYMDKEVESGKTFYYTISASNAFGESSPSLPTAVCSGLPAPWNRQDVGAVLVDGRTDYDGTSFILEGAGAGFGGTNDQFHYAYFLQRGDVTMIARFVPQVSSQYSQFGLMFREATGGETAQVSLLLGARFDEADVERPRWQASLVARVPSGGKAAITNGTAELESAYVTNGRLTNPCWLKLQRSGNHFTGSISSDQRSWEEIGTVEFDLNTNFLAGLAICSGLSGTTTRVTFDGVKQITK